jgi:branched-chain amino acid transport system substrate-binding protein
LSVRPRSRSEALVLGGGVAALVALGVVLGVLLSGGGGGAHGSEPASGTREASVGATSPQASSSAVAQALRHGVLNVVIDEPAAGALAEQSQSIANGATVAADELNASGGLPGHVHVKLIPQSLNGLTASGVQAQLGGDAAGIVILPCDPASQVKLASGVARYGTLLLAPCNGEPRAAQHYATYWPIGMSATDEASGLAAYMASNGYRRVFIVDVHGNHYAELLTGYFRAAARNAGLQIVGSTGVEANTGEFSGVAGPIKEAKPEPTAIFTALPPPLVNRLGSGLHGRGVEVPIFGTTALDTRLTLESGTAGVENAIFPSYGFGRESPALKRFLADYKKRFGSEPVGSFAGLGFEAIHLLDAAAEQAHSAAPGALQSALSRGLTLSGEALRERTYERGSNHNPAGTVALAKIIEGKYEPLTVTLPNGAPAPAP